MNEARSFLGSAAFAGSAILLALEFMDQTYGIPFPMPRVWHVNQALWGFVALALIPLGVGLLKYRPRQPVAWKSSRPGLRFQRVIVYTRGDCPLCDEARELLAGYASYLPPISEVDIETDSQLETLFGTTIPVVEFDGKIRFRGRINEILLRRLIEGTPSIRREPRLSDDKTLLGRP